MDELLTIIAGIGVSSAAVMLVLRVVVIDLLERKGLREELGWPRRFFFSDLLPVRLLFLHNAALGRTDKAVFKIFFFAWAIGTLCLVAAFLITVF